MMLRKVRAVVVRSGVAPQDADDVVHEAFVRRLESYARKQKIRSQEAFLVRAAVDLGRDRARRRARMPVNVAGRIVQFDHPPFPSGDRVRVRQDSQSSPGWSTASCRLVSICHAAVQSRRR